MATKLQDTPAGTAPPVPQHILDELTALRVQVRELQALQRTDAARLAKLAADEAHAKWAELSTEQKSQIEADRRYGQDAGDDYEVSHAQSGSPLVRFPAHSDYEAVEKYKRLCGITSTPPNQDPVARKVPKKAA